VKLTLQDHWIKKSACIEANVIVEGKVNCLFCETFDNLSSPLYNSFLKTMSIY